jgi:hypothetical protein
MKSMLGIAVCSLVALASPVYADGKLSDAEAKTGMAAATALGCEGGEWEKETEGTGVYELDDAKCKDGQFDVKFDKDFKLLNMTRD